MGKAVEHINRKDKTKKLKSQTKTNKSQERGSGLFNEEDEEVGGEGEQRNGTPAMWR